MNDFIFESIKINILEKLKDKLKCVMVVNYFIDYYQKEFQVVSEQLYLNLLFSPC